MVVLTIIFCSVYTCLLNLYISPPPISYLSFTYTCLLQLISTPPSPIFCLCFTIPVFFNLYPSLLHLFPVYSSPIPVFFNLYLSLHCVSPVYPSPIPDFFNLYLFLLRLLPFYPSPISVFLNLYIFPQAFSSLSFT